MIQAKEYVKRRKQLAGKMADNSALILKSSPEAFKNSDTERIYRQNSNFYYLTGMEETGAVLLIMKKDKKVHEFYFTTSNDEHIVTWIGARKEPDDIRQISGISNVLFMQELDNYKESVLGNIETVYYDYHSRSKGLHRLNLLDIEEMRRMYPNIVYVCNAQEIIFPCRIVKSSDEVKAIQKAIDITHEGVMRALQNTKPGMFEYEIRAEIEYAFLRNGSRMPGFPSIVAAGGNAAVLHYVTLDSIVKKDDLVLLDIGADYMNYSADISRTYPASGTFSGKKKDLYSALLDVQKKMIDYVKPGRSMKEVNAKTCTLIGKLLKSFKYIKDEGQYFKYYPHSVGHMLGLDTHDVQGSTRKQPVLKKGMVITIEPGLYIKEENTGIRIEDDILVTEKGRKNLSSSIPKEIKDIERIMGV